MNYKTYSEKEIEELTTKHAEALATKAMQALTGHIISHPSPKGVEEVKDLANYLLLEIGNEAQRLIPDADFETLYEISSELGLATFETCMDIVAGQKKTEQKTPEENKAV